MDAEETVGRLRGDMHALTTWLILARDRIREAEKILTYLNAGGTSERGIEIAAWRKRVKETVWEVKADDIAARGDEMRRLLMDAKRMAEFGDINADMEDDGIGWQQWYLDVCKVLSSG